MIGDVIEGRRVEWQEAAENPLADVAELINAEMTSLAVSALLYRLASLSGVYMSGVYTVSDLAAAIEDEYERQRARAELEALIFGDGASIAALPFEDDEEAA